MSQKNEENDLFNNCLFVLQEHARGDLKSVREVHCASTELIHEKDKTMNLNKKD